MGGKQVIYLYDGELRYGGVFNLLRGLLFLKQGQAIWRLLRRA